MQHTSGVGRVTLRRRIRRGVGGLFLRVFGWEVEGGAPTVDRAVVVAYPHTSNWDMPFTLAMAFALDVDIRWLGKKSLFTTPVFGSLMRWFGGLSVDRSRRTNMVDAVVAVIEPMEQGYVLIPPEGTRSKAGRWKSGFYWVAVGAEVPIILGFLDFGRKRGGLGEVLEPSGDIHADIERIRAFYADVKGKHPEKQGAITLVDGGAAKPGQGAPVTS